MSEPDLNLVVTLLEQVIAEQTAFRGGLTDMRGGLTDMRSDLTALRGDLTALRVGVMDRLDRVETRLTQIRDDITVSIGRADKAHAAADNTRDELRLLAAEVAVLTRKQRMLESQVHDLTRPPDNL